MKVESEGPGLERAGHLEDVAGEKETERLTENVEITSVGVGVHGSQHVACNSGCQ